MSDVSVWTRLRPRSLLGQVTLLTLVVLAAFAVAGPLGYYTAGAAGVGAAGLAGGLCLAGALAALAIMHALYAQQQVAGLILAMTARMGVPLAAGIVVYLAGGGLANSGFFYYLLGFYPLTLGIETALSLPLLSGKSTQGQASQDV